MGNHVGAYVHAVLNRKSSVSTCIAVMTLNIAMRHFFQHIDAIA